MKRFLSLFLALLFVFSLAGPVAADDVSAAPAEGESVSEASRKWREFDHDFLYYMLKEDVSSTNQLIKYPETLNMRPEDVVITLGNFNKVDYDRYYDDMRAFLARLDEIDRSQLLPSEQYAYDAIRTAIEWDLEGEEFYGYVEPLTYSGMQSDLPIVFWLYDIKTEEDAETYLALLATVPTFMEELVTYEQYRVELGIFMPENQLDTVLSDCEAVITSGDDIFLISSFETAVDAIPGLSEERRAEMKARNRELIRDSFIAGYQYLYDELDKLRPYCRPAVGIAELGNEKYLRFYEYFLKSTCGDDVSMLEVASLMEEYILLDWAEAYEAYLDLDGSEFYEGTLSIGTVEENMQYLRELNADMLPEVPESEITYYIVPEKMQDVFPPAAYLVAALDDPSHISIILNKPETDEDLLETLAHEGWYGHLYQYAGVRSRVSSLSQQFLQNSSYSEAFSQMGEYFFVTRTEAFDNNSLKYMLVAQWMENDLISYCSVLVNGFGYTRAQLKTLLQGTFGFDSDTCDAIYRICVEMPFYYMPYTYGLCRFRKMYSELGYTDWKSFYEDCFSVGPTFFHLLEDACRERNGLAAAPEKETPELLLVDLPADGALAAAAEESALPDAA